MSLLINFPLALAILTLLIYSTAAQTCYYPDGSESNQLACRSSGAEAACCDASQVCMDNGLCFGDGIMSRGSCTDRDWNGAECSQFCYNVSRSTSVPVMACTNDGEQSKFTCGMDAKNCRNNGTLFTLPSAGITLRKSELAALINPAVSSALSSATAQTTTKAAVQNRITVTATSAASPDGLYTSGQMAGLGVGLTIPLLIASGFAILLWRRDRARTPKLMYPLPDDMEDPYTRKDGRPLHAGAITTLKPPVSRDGSILSFNTISGTGTPAHMQSFAERYQVMKGAPGFQIQRVELDASPGNYGAGDHEMHDLKVPIPKEI